FRDGSIAEVDEGKPESVWVSERIGRPVVKAWNALLAETLANKGLAQGQPSRIAIPVAGDDNRAEAVIQDLVEETGFDALASGGLSDSWRQQPGTPAYCTFRDGSIAEVDEGKPESVWVSERIGRPVVKAWNA
ncbi:NADPH-dependent F420 reductase, partial [Corynebacterium diphtheriae]